MSLSTHAEVLAKSREVQKYQRGERRSAVEMVNDVYEIALNNDRKLFSIIPGYKCRLCGGIILRRESFFPMITPGGNIIKGCPKCKTMSHNMLNPDIILDAPEMPQAVSKTFSEYRAGCEFKSAFNGCDFRYNKSKKCNSVDCPKLIGFDKYD